MTRDVFVEAQRVGNEWRGMVIDSHTFDQVLVTRHNYSDATVAKEAARREYMEKEAMA